MPKEVWKSVETKVGKIRVGKTKTKTKKEKKRKKRNKKRKNKRKKKENEIKKKKNIRSWEASREMGDLEQGRRNGKVGRKSKETGSKKIPQVDLHL